MVRVLKGKSFFYHETVEEFWFLEEYQIANICTLLIIT